MKTLTVNIKDAVSTKDDKVIENALESLRQDVRHLEARNVCYQEQCEIIHKLVSQACKDYVSENKTKRTNLVETARLKRAAHAYDFFDHIGFKNLSMHYDNVMLDMPGAAIDHPVRFFNYFVRSTAFRVAQHIVQTA